MEIDAPAVRLTIMVGESDQFHGRPVYTEVVHRAHRAGLAGASVFRGIEGFGRSHHVHTTRLLSLSEDLPVLVVVVDAEDKVRAFLPGLEDLAIEGLVMIEPVEVVRYAGRDERRDPGGRP
ncbi:DUF190 domain-containing protein [uncultured Nocardioides sp.]|uniref:DUF190 domain-containing protein n=1 Tax=Nocardioides sp. T5 TaxID=3400182 RepID=UPI00261CC7E1|nr:DUF190 domain-containing protein [uncultured Nocardioides sp.]